MSAVMSPVQALEPTAVVSSGHPLPLATPHVLLDRRQDGSFVLRSEDELKPYSRCVGDWLQFWANEDGSRTLLAERRAGAWHRVSYSDALSAVRRIGQAILNLGIRPESPVVALSENSVNLALLSLAAMHVGRKVSVASAAYSIAARDHSKLHSILDRLKPGMLYAESAEQYGHAIASWKHASCPVVFTNGAQSNSLGFDELLNVPASPAVDTAFAAITGDTVGRVLLTSGSTGTPKLVANTHRMLCANQQMIAQCWPFVDQAHPVVLDWLPWSHTFGSNHNFNLILRNGGSLYIDGGRPVPGAIETTLANIRDVKPTLFFNVPRGYDVLLPYLESDEALARDLFGRLDMLFFAGAALPQQCADRLRAVAEKVRSAPLFFTTEWGSTETTPVVTSAHFHTSDMRNIGVPVPGVELKFAPVHGKFELRVRGPSVFSGYLDDEEKTLEAFDEEGFYRMGDAGKLADADEPSRGVIFDGRVSEDFKLTTGTWVSVGTLRVSAVSALAPYAQDAVVCGHDRDEIGLLLFPTSALRALANDPEGKQCGKGLGQHPEVRRIIGEVLTKLCKGVGSSQRPCRAVILSKSPSIEAGEVTDKGYINQRAVLTLRADDVERLYSECASVIFPS